jgi:hypothetical protein
MNLEDALLRPDEFDGMTISIPWQPLIGNDFSVIHVSVFGNFFLADGNQRIWLLDSWSGQLHGVSPSFDDFKVKVGTDPEFFRSWFLIDFLEILTTNGLSREKGQVFSPFVSPGVGGSLTPKNFTLAPLRAHVACMAGEAAARRQAEVH